jgi:hypothetical protein
VPGDRTLNAQAIFDYEAQPKEDVWVCNLCDIPRQSSGGLGIDMQAIVADQDRYGYSARAVTCLSCGLAFLSPRMTPEAYAKFYNGPYRALVAAYNLENFGTKDTPETLRKSQGIYARQVVASLRPYLPKLETLLDIGGSTGVVAEVLAGAFNLKPTVIDPAAGELPSDIEAFPTLVEDFEPNGRTWDLVTMCQTVDHLLDIAGTLRKVKALMSEGGRFFVDIVDCSQNPVIKIDHPYYLTPKTMERYLRQAGFGIVNIEPAQDRRHVRFLARHKGEA